MSPESRAIQFMECQASVGWNFIKSSGKNEHSFRCTRRNDVFLEAKNAL